MKRIIIILLGAIFAISASAEIYTTVSSERIEIKTPKPPRIHPKLEFYAKVGANIMNADWNSADWTEKYWSSNFPDINGKSKFGLDVTFGFLSHFRPSHPSKFYWGAELSITQVGGSFDEFSYTSDDWAWHVYTYDVPATSVTCWGASISPTIGWKKELVKGISLDLHLNPGILGNIGKDIKYSVTDYNNHFDRYSYFDEYFSINALNVSLKGGIGVWFNKFNIDLSYRGLIRITGYAPNYSNVIISLGYKF